MSLESLDQSSDIMCTVAMLLLAIENESTSHITPLYIMIW
jgi:hypothetical protein